MSARTSRPARCLITGASGFIGTRLCEWLDQQGEQPYVPLVRSRQAAASFLARGVQPAVGDLVSADFVSRAVHGCDAVIHLAHGDRGPEATRGLVAASTKAGVGLFVHISTMSVHGPNPGPEAAREDTARLGRFGNDYSDSKAEQEEIVQAAHDRGDLRTIVLRPTVVYGPRGHFVLQIVQQAREGSVTMFDEGAGICNAVYVDDVCRAIDRALVHQEAIGQAMFINADQPVSWGEFIRTFASMVDTAPRFVDLSSEQALLYWAAHAPTRSGSLLARVGRRLKRLAGQQEPAAPWPPLVRIQRETLRVAFANAKARHLLDWTPEVDFPHGAALTRTWLREAGHLR